MAFPKSIGNFPAVLLVLVVVTLSACDGEPVLGTKIPTVIHPASPPTSSNDPSVSVEPPSRPDGGVSEPPPAGDYDVMCRHYCQMLEDTLFFGCAGAGSEEAGCLDYARATTAPCYDLRCRPQLVTPSTCLLQCDALAPRYDTFCARNPPAASSLCTASPDEHDRTCRNGCRLPQP